MHIITAQALKALWEHNDVLLVDVREAEEHGHAHIPGDFFLPLGTLSAEKLPKTSKPLVMYCRSGKRSMDACVKLLAQDDALDVRSLEGGIMAWHQEGFPIETSGSDILPQEE